MTTEYVAHHIEMEGEEPEVRTPDGWVLVRDLLAQARIDALREAYFLLEPMDYEPLRGTYPEGHIARLIREAECEVNPPATTTDGSDR